MDTRFVDVEILKDGHTHSGLAVPKGATIPCTEPEARWLESNGIGRRKALVVPPELKTPQQET